MCSTSRPSVFIRATSGVCFKVLRHLRDLGNTVVMVEHDPTMIAGADYLVELGPGGGREGGNLIRAGRPSPRPRAASWLKLRGACC